MHSESFVYNFVLLPLVCFGGFSVMLAFVLLLPGVGNFLAVVFTFIAGDWAYRMRLGDSQLADEEKKGSH
jgi:hypothetical protein